MSPTELVVPHAYGPWILIVGLAAALLTTVAFEFVYCQSRGTVRITLEGRWRRNEARSFETSGRG
jgi:hypothetical protein